MLKTYSQKMNSDVFILIGLHLPIRDLPKYFTVFRCNTEYFWKLRWIQDNTDSEEDDLRNPINLPFKTLYKLEYQRDYSSTVDYMGPKRITINDRNRTKADILHELRMKHLQDSQLNTGAIVYKIKCKSKQWSHLYLYRRGKWIKLSEKADSRYFGEIVIPVEVDLINKHHPSDFIKGRYYFQLDLSLYRKQIMINAVVVTKLEINFFHSHFRDWSGYKHEIIYSTIKDLYDTNTVYAKSVCIMVEHDLYHYLLEYNYKFIPLIP